jgi:hypothetical protein
MCRMSVPVVSCSKQIQIVSQLRTEVDSGAGIYIVKMQDFLPASTMDQIRQARDAMTRMVQTEKRLKRDRDAQFRTWLPYSSSAQKQLPFFGVLPAGSSVDRGSAKEVVYNSGVWPRSRFGPVADDMVEVLQSRVSGNQDFNDTKSRTGPYSQLEVGHTSAGSDVQTR